MKLPPRKLIISSQSLPKLLERPEHLSRTITTEVGPEQLDDELEALKRRIDTGRDLMMPTGKKDLMVLAAITARARRNRKKTFITDSGFGLEDVELYPNYGKEVRRKLAEANTRGPKPDTTRWAPSPVIRVYHTED